MNVIADYLFAVVVLIFCVTAVVHETVFWHISDARGYLRSSFLRELRLARNRPRIHATLTLLCFIVFLSIGFLPIWHHFKTVGPHPINVSAFLIWCITLLVICLWHTCYYRQASRFALKLQVLIYRSHVLWVLAYVVAPIAIAMTLLVDALTRMVHEFF
jgi:hypothetical protein